MRLGKIKLIVGIVLSGLSVAASLVMAQQARGPRAQADIKITYKVTMPGGMQSESTTMIKGVRERSEQSMGYGMDMVNITQCDLRQTIQLNDKTKKYIITPMDSGDSSIGVDSGAPMSGGASRRGGVVTMTINTIDST